MNQHDKLTLTDQEAHNVDVFIRWMRGERTGFTDEEFNRMQELDKHTEEIRRYTEIANDATTVNEERTIEIIEEEVLSRVRDKLQIADSIIRKAYGIDHKERLSRDLVFEDMEWLVAYDYKDENLHVSFGSDGKPTLIVDVDSGENIPFFLYMIYMPIGEFSKIVRNETLGKKEQNRLELSDNIDSEINKTKERLAYLEKIKREKEQETQ